MNQQHFEDAKARQAEQAENMTEEEQRGVVEKFRNMARDWWARMQAFERLPVPQTSPLYKRKMALVGRAHAIRNKLEMVPGLGSIFKSEELGAWFIPIVALLGAGSVAIWATSAFKATSSEADRIEFEQKEYFRLVGEGKSPREAATIVKRSPLVVQRNWSDVAYKTLQLLPWIGGGYILIKVAAYFSGERN